MKRIIAVSIFSLSIFFSFSSCKKTAGIGGTSTIKGKLFVAEYNILDIQDSFYVGKEDIYIIYGDNEYFDDKIESSYDGTFEFPYLKKGKYTLFSYGECLPNDSLCFGGKKAFVKEVVITENKQIVDIGDLRIVWLQ